MNISIIGTGNMANRLALFSRPLHTKLLLAIDKPGRRRRLRQSWWRRAGGDAEGAERQGSGRYFQPAHT
jgi:hypothetical protein